MTERRQLAVIGGGPIGLLSALMLTAREHGRPSILEGHEVILFELADARKTAGRSASAFVDPDWMTEDQPTLRRQHDSLAFYAEASQHPEMGVTPSSIYVLRRKPRVLEPGERDLSTDELAAVAPASEFPYGTVSQSYRINPPKFLSAIREELKRRGVRFVQREREIISFQEVQDEFGINRIINAAGVGARFLAKDQTVAPSRGHCARVHLKDAPQEVRLVAGEQTWYVASGPDECRIGGTADANCWDLEPDHHTVDAMFRRVQAIMPVGFDPWAGLIEITCGLRPRREQGTRLEAEHLAAGIDVVHCYGHKSEGMFTQGPGCAIEVRNLMCLILSNHP